MKVAKNLPRDPIDTSLSGVEQSARRAAETLDIASLGSKIRGGSGTAGAEGKEGKAGNTWYGGTTVPAEGLGVAGDWYLRTTTSDVYKKTTEKVWTLELNIKGATGAEGGAGKEGPAGSLENTDWKNSVRAATTANIATATALNPGDAIDGVTLAENDRVLVKDQTTKSQNGIWIVKATPARAADADAVAELSGGSTIYVEEGTRNKRRTFQIITPGNITPGTTAHEYQQLGVRDFGIVEALPTSEAVKGDRCTYVADKTNGVMWELRYDGEGELPWKKVGGQVLFVENANARVLNNQTTYASLPTDPSSITLPLKGDYFIEIQMSIFATSQGTNRAGRISYSVGATAAEDGWCAASYWDGAGNGRIGVDPTKKTRWTNLAAATVVTEKARTEGAFEVSFGRRRLYADPIRVG